MSTRLHHPAPQREDEQVRQNSGRPSVIESSDALDSSTEPSAQNNSSDDTDMGTVFGSDNEEAGAASLD